MKIKFWSFRRSRKYTRKLGLKTKLEWDNWVKTKRNKFIPVNPYNYYMNKGWMGWMDWMDSDYLSFKRARKLIRSLKLKSYKEWLKWLKSGNRPFNMPVSPQLMYKNRGWINWEDWIGGYDKYLSYKNAIILVKKMGFKSQNDWFKRYDKLIRSKNLRIPMHPHKVYKKQWVSWMKWLSTNNKQGGNRKYNINHNYFKMWSPNMSYILGFWFADGCISKHNVVSIHLHKKDKYLLQQFSKEMESEYPLYNSSCGKYWSLGIRSKKIYDDIIKKGGKERKSLDVKFPHVPRKYLPDFVRGYWDGDGSIFLTKGRASYKSSCVSGSKNFVVGLRDCLCKNINRLKPRIYIGKNKKSKNYYRLILDINDTRRLRKFIYNKKSCLKIARKYKKFIKAGEIKKDIRDRTLLSYAKSHKIIKKFNIRTQMEWNEFCKTSRKPLGVPANPYSVYKNKGWTSWTDFLCTSNLHNQKTT